MKLLCGFCGVHFVQDFDLTLKSPCNFWGEHGLSNIDIEDKRKLWGWAFAMPSDELYIKHGVGITLDFRAVPTRKGMEFKEIFSNYEELSEEEQQQLQRKYYKGEVKYLGEQNG